MSDIMNAYWASPALARTTATAIFVVSISVHLGILPYMWLYLSGDRLWRFPPEIWRIITSYLVSSPQLGIILDPYFTFQYLKDLEHGNPRFQRREDVIWYLITVGGSIMVLSCLFTGHIFFLQGLILALCYTSVQDRRGEKANFFFFTVPAQLVPYCMMLVTLLVNPPNLPLQIVGLLCAHMHDFLTRLYPEFGGGPNLLPTPAFMSRLLETPRVLRRDYGTAIRNNGPGSDSASGRSTGASTGSVLPDSWRSRGTGHRLGGN